jgi:hypothetical protein
MNPLRRSFMIHSSLALTAAVAMRPARVAAKELDSARCWRLSEAAPADTGPGRKFSSDGKVQPYPGNTVLCPIPRPSAIFDEMNRAYGALRSQFGGGHFTWLPPTSYHMTVFDGVTDAFRRPGDWPQMLPLNATLTECNGYVADRLRKLDLGITLPLRMVIDDPDPSGVSSAITLRPVDSAENNRLRELRDRISTAVGIRHGDHDVYRFHTSFAYYVRQLAGDEEERYRQALSATVQQLRTALPVIELGAPEFCLFDDMYAFRTQFNLR